MILFFKCNSNPSSKTGATINKADIYCELIFPAISMCPPFNFLPIIRSGGNPSSSS